ncbi:hypothetical protein TYRP_008593 [Tyrophagus putrescentiae]|nr:hypothetical protein TYRP_008593 [Tyrophagus putrescentiae]
MRFLYADETGNDSNDKDADKMYQFSKFRPISRSIDYFERFAARPLPSLGTCIGQSSAVFLTVPADGLMPFRFTSHY